MVLTGRTGLVALICVLPIALSPWPARAFVVLLVALAIVVVVDIGAGGQHPQIALYPFTGQLRPARPAGRRRAC